MMEHQECNFALVEIGEAEKTGYLFLQGEDQICKNSTLAHTYWYPDDITQEEINQEILDLAEHYKNIAILLPIPAQLQLEVLKQ